MALPRGLCALLVLWLAVTRPPVANQADSPTSAPWWGARHFSDVSSEAKRLRQAADYGSLEILYRAAVGRARALKIVAAEVTYLTALANTYTFQLRYAEALDSYGAARSLAEANGLWEMAGATAPGISSIYYQFGDEDAALQAIQEGMEAANRMGRPPYYEAALRLQKARLAPANEETIRQAIRIAGRTPENRALEALGWDLLADRFLESGELIAAQEALAMGLRLRQSMAGRGLLSSYWRLSKLRLAQAERVEGTSRRELLDAAGRYNERAHSLATELERPILRHQRGQIEAERGRTTDAIHQFRAAVETVAQWRSAAPMAASSMAAADHEVHEEILGSFVEAAAGRSVNTGDGDLARESFLAVEVYRAASLRHTRDLASVWRQKLPPRYWAALSELRVAEAAQIGSHVPNEQVDRLRLEITEMEAYASIGISLNQYENFLGQTSLIHFQRGLAREDLLLSFHLGKRQSFLWAVSREGLQIYQLPPAARIASRAEMFRKAILEHRAEQVEALGEELYRLLFGQLKRTELAKESWLLSLEGVLFELPFAALRAGGAGSGAGSGVGSGAGSGDGRAEYLVQRHSLQVVPGALLLGQRSGAPGGRYLAVGDPIYNVADPRYKGVRRAGARGLNRLAASRDEIRRSAATRSGEGVILEGRDASRERIAAAVAEGALSTLHLSTHVVQNALGRDRAFLALSLDSSGTPELLGAADIALLHVPGSLVVMTGCASGTGEVVPGAGLLGLTRGWLVAGAASVVATAWPIPDAGGDVIPHFFGYTREVSPAAALRRSQIEAIGSATWQADPAYWASFQVTGGAR